MEQVRSIIRHAGGAVSKMNGAQRVALRDARGRLTAALRAQGATVSASDPDLADAPEETATQPQRTTAARASSIALQSGLVPASLRRKRRRTGPERLAPQAAKRTAQESAAGTQAEATLPVAFTAPSARDVNESAVVAPPSAPRLAKPPSPPPCAGASTADVDSQRKPAAFSLFAPLAGDSAKPAAKHDGEPPKAGPSMAEEYADFMSELQTLAQD